MKQTDPTVTRTAAPVAPSTTWKEDVKPDEHELFEDFAHKIITAQQKEVARSRQAARYSADFTQSFTRE
jgi:hypothetical protein